MMAEPRRASSTKTRRMTSDWVKAMLSGCVIVSDCRSSQGRMLLRPNDTKDAVPTESEEDLAQFIIQYPFGSDRAVRASNLMSVDRSLINLTGHQDVDTATHRS